MEAHKAFGGKTSEFVRKPLVIMRDFMREHGECCVVFKKLA